MRNVSADDILGPQSRLQALRTLKPLVPFEDELSYARQAVGQESSEVWSTVVRSKDGLKVRLGSGGFTTSCTCVL